MAEKSRYANTIRIVVLFALVVSLPMLAHAAGTSEIVLTVQATPVESTYSLKRFGQKLNEWQSSTNDFLIHVCVSNTNRTPCAVLAMSCSYYDEWRTDNADVSIRDWDCDKNFPAPHILDSTNVYSENLSILIDPARKLGDVTFRLGFQSDTNFEEDEDVRSGLYLYPVVHGIFWSNPIKINVVP
jgi:hypothetical protein